MSTSTDSKVYFNDLDTLLFQARALVNLIGLAGNEHIVSNCVADPESIVGGAWLANDLLARAEQIIEVEAETRRNAAEAAIT